MHLSYAQPDKLVVVSKKKKAAIEPGSLQLLIGQRTTNNGERGVFWPHPLPNEPLNEQLTTNHCS
jgi:hypothetical protein